MEKYLNLEFFGLYVRLLRLNCLVQAYFIINILNYWNVAISTLFKWLIYVYVIFID